MVASEYALENQSILRHGAVDGFRPSVNAAAHVVDIAKAFSQHLLGGVLAAHPVVTQKSDRRVAVERKQILLAGVIERPSLGNARERALVVRANVEQADFALLE